MKILDALQWRYATKKFDPDKRLTEDQVSTLKEAFNLTATSYGLQPVKLLVIENVSQKEALLPFSYNQKQVRDASHLLVFAVEENIDASFIRKYFDRVKDVRNTPEDILSPYRNFLLEDFGNKDPERIREWATRQAYLAMGNLLTVCAVEGIDACPMEGFQAEGYSEMLQLADKGLYPVLVMPVGFRASDDFFATLKKVRKPLEESVEDVK